MSDVLMNSKTGISDAEVNCEASGEVQASQVTITSAMQSMVWVVGDIHVRIRGARP